MTDFLVNNVAELNAAVKTALSGDVIRLAAGDYGDLLISKKVYATDLTITSADPAAKATFNTVSLMSSSGITLDNVAIHMAPTMTTTTASSVLRINASDHITILNSLVAAGSSINGVSQDAAALDSTGNVLGLPVGRGIDVQNASVVTIQNTEITQVQRGIVLGDSSDVVIRGNNIHDTRTSPIVGGGLNRVTIDGNRLSSANPWGWGDPTKDHGDFIHLWTDDGQAAPSTGITITNNVLDQGTGAGLLGIYLDDNGQAIGFTNATITGNVIISGHNLGVALEHVMSSTITNNVLLQQSGLPNQAPGIAVSGGSSGLEISGNLAAFVQDTNKTTDHVHDNVLVQHYDNTIAGYYDMALVDYVDDLSASAGRAYALSHIVLGGVKLQSPNNLGAVLTGGVGNDTLVGLGGADTLQGGGGNDYITGNGGNDVLVGGTGADKFVFGLGHETKGGTDTILDFSSLQKDKIDLHSIDANSLLIGNQTFVFIGASPFHKLAGELHYEVHGTDAWVVGDINGDGLGDFTIKLAGAIKVIAGDFLL